MELLLENGDVYRVVKLTDDVKTIRITPLEVIIERKSQEAYPLFSTINTKSVPTESVTTTENPSLSKMFKDYMLWCFLWYEQPTEAYNVCYDDNKIHNLYAALFGEPFTQKRYSQLIIRRAAEILAIINPQEFRQKEKVSYNEIYGWEESIIEYFEEKYGSSDENLWILIEANNEKKQSPKKVDKKSRKLNYAPRCTPEEIKLCRIVLLEYANIFGGAVHSHDSDSSFFKSMQDVIKERYNIVPCLGTIRRHWIDICSKLSHNKTNNI